MTVETVADVIDEYLTAKDVEIARLRALIKELDRRVMWEAVGLGNYAAEKIEVVANGGPCPTVAELYGHTHAR